MSGWQAPDHLRAAEAARRGRVEDHVVESASRPGARIAFKVYVPAGYRQGQERLPVALVMDGDAALEQGLLAGSLDKLHPAARGAGARGLPGAPRVGREAILGGRRGRGPGGAPREGRGRFPRRALRDGSDAGASCGDRRGLWRPRRGFGRLPPPASVRRPGPPVRADAGHQPGRRQLPCFSGRAGGSSSSPRSKAPSRCGFDAPPDSRAAAGAPRP